MRHWWGKNQTLTVPKAGRDEYEFYIQGPPGPIELLILASPQSLRKTLKGLQSVAKRGGHSRGVPLTVNHPQIVLSQLLKDTTQGTRASVKYQRKTRLVDADNFAAIKVPLQVI